MSDTQKIVRVFIGSPGGLREERQAAQEVVQSINRSHSERWGVQLKLLGWEDTVPGFVRPQTKINEDLDRCDYFLGVLWDRWGSRPSTDPDGYTSGFEEEYSRAKDRIENLKMKDMALYFKDIIIPQGLQAGEEMGKVLAFKEKCINEKKVFFKTFADLRVFKDIIRDKLEEIGWRETNILVEKPNEVDQPKAQPAKEDKAAVASNSVNGLFEPEALSFMRGMLDRSSDWDETAPWEIARLRLATASITRSGNDDFTLGNHDANLIFQKYRESDLSAQEIRGLIDCGV